ncbi:hypothetical protein [Roseobacter sp. A03A-229]
MIGATVAKRMIAICCLMCSQLVAMTGALHAQQVSPTAVYGNWAVFVDGENRSKTCWAASFLYEDLEAAQEYILAVTQFPHQANPQISIFSNKRMSRSVGIFLNVAGRDYRMRSDGTNAWVSKRQENSVVGKLLEAANSGGLVRAGSKGFGSVEVNMTGFSDALGLVLSECGRR